MEVTSFWHAVFLDAVRGRNKFSIFSLEMEHKPALLPPSKYTKSFLCDYLVIQIKLLQSPIRFCGQQGQTFKNWVGTHVLWDCCWRELLRGWNLLIDVEVVAIWCQSYVWAASSVYCKSVTCGEVRGWGSTVFFKANFASIWIERTSINSPLQWLLADWLLIFLSIQYDNFYTHIGRGDSTVDLKKGKI